MDFKLNSFSFGKGNNITKPKNLAKKAAEKALKQQNRNEEYLRKATKKVASKSAYHLQPQTTLDTNGNVVLNKFVKFI